MGRNIVISFATGVTCVALLWLINEFVWFHSTYPAGANSDVRTLIWAKNTFTVKLAGLALMFLSSVGIAIYHRANWKLAIAYSIIAALIFQTSLIGIYVVRHGYGSYSQHHNELKTGLFTVLIPYCVAFFVSLKSFLAWTQLRRARSRIGVNARPDARF